MKDFKLSYEQRRWERAAESHARATKALTLIATMRGAEEHKKYWEKVRDQTEKDYPELRKVLITPTAKAQ